MPPTDATVPEDPAAPPGDAATPQTAPPAQPARRGRLAAAVSSCAWLYAAAMGALALLLYFAADRWWLGTVAMYSPRWVWGAPLALLLPAAALLRRRALVPLLVAAVIVVGPVMRFCVPWGRVFGPASPAQMPTASRLRVMTCNVDGPSLDPAAFKALIEETQPDVVAVQGWVARYHRTIFGRWTPEGWHLRRDGEMFLASRHPIADAAPSLDPAFGLGIGDLVAYELNTPAGRVHLISLHLATPRRGLKAFVREGPGGREEVQANLDLRRRQFDAARAVVDGVRAKGGARGDDGRVVVAGDFNSTTDSALYRRFSTGLTNAFSAAGFGFGNTHFTRLTAIRIDHVLAGPSWRVRRAWVAPSVGSGHRPVIADLETITPAH